MRTWRRTAALHLLLQWSRFFSKRKMLGGQKTGTETKTASMEPLFFKAENRSEKHDARCQSGKTLQWSRFFSKRKIGILEGRRYTIIDELQWSRFFSKRKICIRRISALCRIGFNGAAFFQSGKCFWHAESAKA